MTPRALAALGALVAAMPAAGQQSPVLTLLLRQSSPPEVLVSVSDLLGRREFLDALRSGFPLYMEYQVALRQSQTLKDRTVTEAVWESVVLYDPVRERFAIETPDGREVLPDQEALRLRLARVHVFGLEPDRPGSFYYQAQVEARTLSDEDVDEAFAWLRGERGDSARLRDPGPVARLARRVLMRVTALPRVRLEGRTEAFTVGTTR